MRKIIKLIWLLLPIGALASNETSLINNYIEDTGLSFYQQEQAKDLASALNRVQIESWWDSENVFNAISKDINKSLSCYMHSVKERENSLRLIDELEFLVADTMSRKKTYQQFISKDNQNQHTITPEEKCY